jgi:uncharacterized protein YkwD
MTRRVLPAILFLSLPYCFAQTAPTSRPAKPVDLYALSPAQFFKRPEADARIKKDSVDIPLLEAAIFQATNQERLDLKLPLFKHSWTLNLAARKHSQEMSDLQFFDHFSPTAANHTLGDRLKNVGLPNVNCGENLAVLPAMEMGSGSRIITDNPDGTQTLTDEKTGQRIDYYTYAELARTVADQWMHSPPHRANIVNPQYHFLGVGAVRGPYDKGQDSFYMTQNFSAAINASEVKSAKELAGGSK